MGYKLIQVQAKGGATTFADVARHTEQGKPVLLPMTKPSVKAAGSGVGKGGVKKRKPYCNDADTGGYLARKRSDF